MTVERDNLRVALIGYGLAGSVFHAPTIACTPGLKLTSIVTTNAERARQAIRDYSDVKIIASTEALFAAREEHDLVVVAAPNKFHCSLATEALTAGMAVVVDKPPARNSVELTDLIACAKKHDRLLTVYHNRRWDGDFLTVRRLVQQGLLGELNRFESRFERFRPAPKPDAWRELADPDQAGGLLFDLGSHLIDQACLLFGRPESVYAEVRLVRPGAKVDDDVFVALHFKGGMRAHLWATCIARIAGPRFKLNGLKGSFEKYGLDPQEDALRTGGRPLDAGWGTDSEDSWGRLSATVNGINFDGKVETEPGCYQAFYANVRDAVHGKAELAVKPEEALLSTRIIEAAFKSSVEGRLIGIDSV